VAWEESKSAGADGCQNLREYRESKVIFGEDLQGRMSDERRQPKKNREVEEVEEICSTKGNRRTGGRLNRTRSKEERTLEED